jgi:hypothetical protein
MRSISISDVQVFGSIVTASITGIPGHPVEDVTLRDIRIQTDEKARSEWSHNVVPEREHGYAEGTAFGRLPSFGLYCRHVSGLHLNGIEVRSSTSDPRPMIHCEDVEDVTVSGLGGTPPVDGVPMVLLRDARNVVLHGNHARSGTGSYVRIEGKNSSEISLFGNDLHSAAAPLVCADTVSRKTIWLDGLRADSTHGSYFSN